MRAKRDGGLEGVVIGETELSHVDGEAGRLVVRGLDVEALVRRARFEDVCGLLWDGALPDAASARRLRAGLGAARAEAFAGGPTLPEALRLGDSMDALRAATARLDGGASPAELRLRLTGALPVYAAGWMRARQGEAPLAPDPGRAHAEDYLRILLGREPEPERVAGLDAYLVTVADHGMNASTFTARVVASTESDPVSAVVAAIGALKGPAHGGAPGPVLDMLEQIEKPERARDWIERRLEAGERIMGMGHRVYRARDPRVAVLEREIERLEASGLARAKLELARAAEREALAALRRRHPDRPLACNVEFYTAVLLDAIGIPRALFTPTFAVARVAGWLAHIEEQRRKGRLIRPSVRYVGPLPESHAPLEAR